MGWGGGGISLTGIQLLVKQRCGCTFPPSPLLPLSIAWCWCYMQVNSTSWGHHPIENSHPSPLPSALPAQGIDLAWRWVVTRNSLDHTPCVVLTGLARPKKVPATVKLCLWGRDCEAKCLRSFSHAKSYIISFHVTPKLSDLVVVITEESNFLYSLL